MLQALVTGATGLLGSHLIEALLAAGIHVRAYARPTSHLRHLESKPVEVHVGRPDDQDALPRAVAGADFVFHLAWHLSAASPFEAVRDGESGHGANLKFTHRLLAASHAAGARRFVFASSASVYDPAASSPIAEDAPLHPASRYGKSKLEAEQAVCEYGRLGLPTTVIRPPVFYGPGDRHFTPLALRLARLPALPAVNGGRQRFDLMFVRDVADLLLCAARAEQAAGQIYNAGPPAPTTVRDLIEAFRAITGQGPRLLPISAPASQRIAWLSRPLLARLAPGAEAALSPLGLELMGRDFYLSAVKARVELGFTPRYDLREGLALTLR